MKKFLITLVLMSTIGIGVSQAKVATDSWGLGLGLSYPGFYSVNITALNSNYGGYLSIQRNFSENVGLRLKGGYSHLQGQWTDGSLNLITETTNLISGDIGLLYYLVPCAPVSPYLFAGVGAEHRSITNGQTGNQNNNKLGSELNVGCGAEFKISPNWGLVTEFGYHVTDNSEFDGAVAPTEINGRDSYLVLSIGANFLFGKGKPSKLCEPCNPCQPCQGKNPEMKDLTDYNRIEDMIVKHIPKEVTKDVVVDRYIMELSKNILVLVGVNFDFDKSDLLPESYPVLDKAVKLLSDKPDVNVEIQGYTDYIGTMAYNQELSLERAQTVKSYLVSKGIAENRLTAIGYGKNNPVENNKTEEGRAMNRRIVFKIK